MEQLVSTEGNKLDADKALLALGSLGRYQLRALLFPICVTFFNGIQLMGSVFYVAQPPYNCTNANISSEEQCLAVDSGMCSDVQFDPTFGNTIVSEWHLICGRKYLANLSSSGYFAGFLLGNILAPMAADRWGRRPALLVSLAGLTTVVTLLAVSPTFWVFCILRMATGFCAAGAVVAAFVIACEVMEPKKRTYIGTLKGVAWVVAYCSGGLVAWMLPDWRHMALALAAPCWATISYYWLKSLHWYVANNKMDEAKNWITKAARCNGVQVDWEMCYGPKKVDSKKTSIFRALKDPLFTLYIAVQAYIWFANSLIYYGLSLFVSQLAGNRYVNHLLSGLVELPAYFALSVFFNCLGRKKTMSLFHLCAAVALVSLPFLDKMPSAAQTTVWLLGKSCVTLTFMGAWMHAGEVFPTTIRSTSVGICSIAARIGGVLAPFVGTLAEFGKSVPPLSFGAMSFLASVLVVLLPETKGRKLPDDMDDL